MKDRLDGIRPPRDDRPTRKIIEGVARVGYEGVPDPTMTPFCGSLAVALKAMGDPVSYSYIAGVSGMAFRMSVKDWGDLGSSDIMHMAPDPFASIRHAFAGIGYNYTVRLCDGTCLTRWGESPVAHWGWASTQGTADTTRKVTEQEAREEIKASIDAGRPVLPFGVIGPPEVCVVTGYDQDGATLIGWNYHQEHSDIGQVEHESTGYFRKTDWFKETPAYILIGPKSRNAQHRAARRQAYVDALKWISELVRVPAAAGRHTGLAAFKEWEQMLYSKDFAGLSVDELRDRLECHCAGLMMLLERKCGAAFLRTMARDEPDSNPELEKAAALYDMVAQFGREVWKHVSWDENGWRRFGEAQVREVLAGHVKEAGRLEEEAVGLVERLLKRLGQLPE